MKTLIKEGSVYAPGGFRKADILLNDGVIDSISASLAPDGAERIVDARGLHVIPALADVHVHFREPGYEYKETIAGGCDAAERGGFSLVCPMPNLSPVPDSPEHLEVQTSRIPADAGVKVLPWASITRGRAGRELVDYQALAPHVAGFSDDGSGVQDEEVMLRAMQGIAAADSLLAAHCEVNSLLRGGYIHDGRYAAAHGHKGICSESEWREVERDIRLAEATGCRLHICHVSTQESVELVRRGKERGVRVTCETAPHYLLLCDDDLQDDGRFKMNPPLRSAGDREALLRGIVDGTIDVIATDHAPHSAEEKSRGLAKSAMGVVGLETSFAASYAALVASGLISFEKLVELMSVNPRRLLRLPSAADGLQPGYADRLLLVATDRPWTVNPAHFAGKGRATPFEGMTFRASVVGLI